MEVGVITGDIVHSRSVERDIWMKELKSVLRLLDKSGNNWQIYRGDSFQIQTEIQETLRVAILIKAHIKQMRGLDVRMGIGLGEMENKDKPIAERNGSAFIRSGECFDKLKKARLSICSGNTEWDEEMNLYLNLASLTMDNWKSATATDIATSLCATELNQSEIAEKLGKSQSTLSENLRRGGYDEIRQLLLRYRKKVTHYD